MEQAIFNKHILCQSKQFSQSFLPSSYFPHGNYVSQLMSNYLVDIEVGDDDILLLSFFLFSQITLFCCLRVFGPQIVKLTCFLGFVLPESSAAT